MEAALTMSASLRSLQFPERIKYIYAPLEYAWPIHQQYIECFGKQRKRIIWLGMNPGPHGMAQTAIPFGEVETVKSWLKLTGAVQSPQNSHPKKPVIGLSYQRSEVSGKRLWGLFKKHYKSADAFFSSNYVINYCPLMFLDEAGRNITPDRLPKDIRTELEQICDRHLQSAIKCLSPQWIVGVGKYAHRIAKQNASGSIKTATILHPSPANPAANQNWAAKAVQQLQVQGVIFPTR